MEQKIANILFYRTGIGNIGCKVNFNNGGISYQGSQKSKYQYNKTKDKEKYPYIITFDYIKDFLSVNTVTDCVIDETSVKKFYGFHGRTRLHTFIKPTQKQVDNWHGHDAPNLYRYEVNIGEVGVGEIYNRTLLADWRFNGSHISSDITEEEIICFTKGHETAIVSKAMRERVI